MDWSGCQKLVLYSLNSDLKAHICFWACNVTETFEKQAPDLVVQVF